MTGIVHLEKTLLCYAACSTVCTDCSVLYMSPGHLCHTTMLGSAKGLDYVLSFFALQSPRLFLLLMYFVLIVWVFNLAPVFIEFKLHVQHSLWRVCEPHTGEAKRAECSQYNGEKRLKMSRPVAMSTRGDLCVYMCLCDRMRA